MSKPNQSTPFDNVFYYTWLVDLSFLDGTEKDVYSAEAEYVTSTEANDNRFLKKDIFIFYGTFSNKDMRTLLDLYVYKQCKTRGDEQIGNYYTEWLNHTISISKEQIPEIAKWCENFNIDVACNTFNPPKFASIKLIDAKGNEITQQINIDEHFCIINVLQELTSSNPLAQEAPTVTILNGSDVSGLASREKTVLADQGFNVVAIADASAVYPSSLIIDNSAGAKPNSAAVLKKDIKGPTVTSTSSSAEAGEATNYSTDFVVVLGQDWDHTATTGKPIQN